MKRKLSEHWRQRVTGRFAGDISFWWGIEEIKEVRYTVGLLAALLDITLMMFFGYSFFRATVISILFDVGCNLTVSIISMISQRRYRIRQNAMNGIQQTLNRLALNKTRKSHASKTGFEN